MDLLIHYQTSTDVAWELISNVILHVIMDEIT